MSLMWPPGTSCGRMMNLILTSFPSFFSLFSFFYFLCNGVTIASLGHQSEQKFETKAHIGENESLISLEMNPKN